MSVETGLLFFLALLVFAVTPGPGIFAILANSLRFGAMASFPLSLGMAISDIVYLIAACLGLAALAETGHLLFNLVRYVGAAYLIYLAWQMWRAPTDLDSLDSAAKTSRVAFWPGFVQGFLISASNPKVILFYLAFLPTFLDLTQLATSDIAIASALAFSALMIGLMAVATIAGSARKKLQSPRSVRLMNRFSASIMGAAGVYLASRQA